MARTDDNDEISILASVAVEAERATELSEEAQQPVQLTAVMEKPSLARSANLPEGLSILLALISSFFYYEQSYLSIYCTDFHLSLIHI